MKSLYDFYDQPYPLLAWYNSQLDDLEATLAYPNGDGSPRTAADKLSFVLPFLQTLTSHWRIAGDHDLAKSTRQRLLTLALNVSEWQSEVPRHAFVFGIDAVLVSDAELEQFKRENPDALAWEELNAKFGGAL